MRIEELLEDQAWLRRLARSLVRDPSLADDLVQEGWLRALTNPPGRHVRSWWRAVLVRRAIDLRREAERRRAREGRVPAPEAPSDDLLERVEMQEAVAHAVRGLPEPYRGAILLRYFEGLPPRAIARRLGIPVETVRTHLKRAHAMLREGLDRERRDWKGAMLLLAWPGSIPKLMGGIAAVAHTKKLSLVALVLLVLSFSLVLTGGGLRGTEPPPRAAEVARTVVVPETEAPAAAPPAHAGWSIAVRTLRKDAGAFPGASVEARVILDGAVADEQRLTTDSLGNALWLLPKYAETLRLEVTATSPGVAEARKEALVAAGSDPPGTIELKLGLLDALITGRVLDPRGEPIEGASVRSAYSRAATGADGRYSLKVPADTTFVWGVAPGHAFERAAVKLREGRGTADLRLREEFRIRGVVKDEEGRPVRGAVLRTFFTGFEQHAVSDREGRYLLAHLDPGRDAQMLSAGHPAFAPFSEQVPTSGREAEVDVVLRPGLPLAGRVEGPDGKPVAGATIRFPWAHDTVSFGSMEVKSGADGGFAFGTRLPAGEQLLTVDHRSLAPATVRIVLPTDGPVVIRLEAPREVAGTAVDDLGEPIEIHIAARARTGDGLTDDLGRYVGSRGKSDASGRWRIDGLPAGTLALEFFGEGYQRTTVEGVEAGRQDVKAVIQRAATFAGRVVDDATGAAVRSFTLRVVSATGRGLDVTWVREGYRFDDPEGRWTIDEEFPPGAAAEVEVRADGYARAHASAVAAIEPDPEGCIVRLNKGITVEGVVVDGDSGDPIEGAVVRIEPPGMDIYGDETHRRLVQHTAADGRFRFPSMLPGFALRVEHTRFAPFVQREVGTEPLTIRLHGGCVIEGTAAPGDEVVLIGGDRPWETLADDRGRFRFERLPEGEYNVAKRERLALPRMTKYAHPVVRPVKVSRGTPADVELKPLGTATIRGSVAGTQDVEGAIAYLYGGEQVGLSVFVRGRRFELGGVAAGRYHLIADGCEPLPLDIADGEIREVTVRPKD